MGGNVKREPDPWDRAATAGISTVWESMDDIFSYDSPALISKKISVSSDE